MTPLRAVAYGCKVSVIRSACRRWKVCSYCGLSAGDHKEGSDGVVFVDRQAARSLTLFENLGPEVCTLRLAVQSAVDSLLACR